MAQRESSRDIDQTASDWTARLDRGPLSAEEEHAFQAWLAGDPRRKGAMLRARAMAMMSESAQALGDGFDPADFAAPKVARLSRRQALIWGGGAAAASLAALAVGLPAAAGTVISTERGEIRLAPLKDGSTVLLNTETRIRVRYDKGRRIVALLEGEAYFSVARDDRRPFIVQVDGRRLSTAQANFRVRKLERAPVDVLVNQGLVEVAPTLVSAQPVRLADNTRLMLSDRPGGDRPRAVAPEVVTRELAWREGKLAFEGETLSQAAEVFARYSDTRIQIGDPVLAREPVTGLFAANDPVGFSRAIARVFDARLEQRGDTVVLSTRSVAE
ncbi:FecR family protein [Caulobacter sp. UC70_42]|uniref:FecR family protein n=1 Tax=Caulobacter sp. UC70_42 TaxID=3374551 RepID=UPI003756C9DF